MIDPTSISPLLNNMVYSGEIGKGPSGTVYLLTRRTDGKKMAVKHISIPSSSAETRALIISGAAADERAAQRYYSSLVKDIKDELLLINNVKNGSNLHKFRGYQIDQKIVGSGYDIYLLSDYNKNLSDYLKQHAISSLEAVNLGIDLCCALEQLRDSGLVHTDVHPGNIFQEKNNHFTLGDLGIVPIQNLKYDSVSDNRINEWTAPEASDPDAGLNETVDIYSVGRILYQIFNGGSLPDSDTGPLSAPEFAEDALSEIILKACASDPADRYASPTDFKQALVIYLQQGNVTLDPIVPIPESELSENNTMDEVDSDSDAKVPDSSGENSDDTEPHVPDLIGVEEPEEIDLSGRTTLNDLEEDELLLPSSGDISIADFISSYRADSSIEVMSMDEDGNMTLVPGYETEETLPDDTEYVYSADTHYIAADETEIDEILDTNPDFADMESVNLDKLDESAPVSELNVPPASDICSEPEDISSSEPLEDWDSDFSDTEAVDTENVAEAVTASSILDQINSAVPSRMASQEIPIYENGEDEDYDYDDDDDDRGSGWKKVLIAIIVILLLAGGAYGTYVFKTDTVKSINAEVLSSTSININADMLYDSDINVVCSSSAGNVSTLPLNEDGTVFEGLDPNTTYNFALESNAGRFLLGGKAISARTADMTNINAFAASRVSAVGAELVWNGTGRLPEAWVINLVSESGEVISNTTTEIPFTLEGLTPETTYSATLERSDGDLLSGTTTCTFTTQEYTVLTALDVTSVDQESISIEWAFTGTVPASWTVNCEGSDGSVQTYETNDTFYTFGDLVSDVDYTFTVTCESIGPSEIESITERIPSVEITAIDVVSDETGTAQISWTYTSTENPTTWEVAYGYISSPSVLGPDDTVVTANDTTVTIENLIPNTNYRFSILTADGTPVAGSNETTFFTEYPPEYSNYGANNATLTLYSLEQNADSLETPTTTFSIEEHIAFAVQVSYDATAEDKTAATKYVIRDADGNPYYVYESSRTWPGTWTTARHTGDLPDLPQNPGNYTLDIYFDNALMASAAFTVE